MSDEKRSFSQILLLALIPTVTALGSAYLANDASNSAADVDDRMAIIQLRSDENALIGVSGFLLPVGDDGMWRDYYACRTQPKEPNDRVNCSHQVKRTSRQSTNPRVAESANLY
ncbi:MAG: hypothetical protein GY928_07130 [Colwellia sp.]|nr:hypothetical protein [Colwellia sp.]